MKHKIEDFDFFERGLALVIASLDSADEIIQVFDANQSAKLVDLIDDFSDVDEYSKWKELDSNLKTFNDQLFMDQNWANNQELYCLLTEPLFLNKYLDLLLISSDYHDVELNQVEKVLKDNFHGLMKTLTTHLRFKEFFPDEFQKVAQILVNEENNQDLMEGFQLLFGHANNAFLNLEGDYLAVYRLLVEADAILAYLSFVIADDYD